MIESSSFRKADAEDFIINQTRAIDAKEQEIASILALLNDKYNMLNEIEHDSNLVCNMLAVHRDRLPGLCIRCVLIIHSLHFHFHNLSKDLIIFHYSCCCY